MAKILDEDIGARLSKVFEHIEPQPAAAASLSQVHYAVLRDGRAVALKVQRPGIREQVLDDLAALGELAAFLEEHTQSGSRFGIDSSFAYGPHPGAAIEAAPPTLPVGVRRSGSSRRLRGSLARLAPQGAASATTA